MSFNLEEKQYLDLMKNIIENGSMEEGRNGKTQEKNTGEKTGKTRRQQKGKRRTKQGPKTDKTQEKKTTHTPGKIYAEKHRSHISRQEMAEVEPSGAC
jgi:multimeric flavodoxin WrbA